MSIWSYDFKLYYPLQAQQPGVSATGFQSIGLPYNRLVGIGHASQLKDDVEAGGVLVGSIQMYDILGGQNWPYPPTDFVLIPGRGYLIGVTTIQKYDMLTGQNIPYPPTDFPLVPGEAHLISVAGTGPADDIIWLPNHC
jgi:hypothetical protein